MTEPDTLERLQSAQRLFRQERFAEVLAALESVEEPSEGGAALALRLASEGSLLAAEGQPDAAMELMERALADGAHLPDVLARLAGFFSEHDKPMLAQHAFLLADTVAPGSLAAFVNQLPEAAWARYAPWALRSSPAARREDLYGNVRYKHALVEQHGPEGAALTLAGMVKAPCRGIANQKHLTFLEDHAREHGQDFRVLIAGGPTVSTPTRRFEDEPGPTEKRAMRSVYTATLEDVVVTSKSSFLLTGDAILLDVTATDLTYRSLDLSVDPAIVSGEPDQLIYLDCENPSRLRRVPEAISLCGTHSRAFGHWIMEYLPRLWALMDVAGFENIPILIDEHMPDQHRQSLRFFLGASHPLIEVRWGERILVERLRVSSSPTFLAIGPLSTEPGRISTGIDDTAYQGLLDRVRPRLRSVVGGDVPRRIYLRRKATQHRRLVNDDDVSAELARRGFEAFDFEELAFDEQLRLVRGAKTIVAAGGSASFMTIFAEPGLEIGILNPPTIKDLGWFTQACRVLGFGLTAIVGEIVTEHDRYRWLSDYRIDMDQLHRYLDQIDATSSSDDQA